jgi:FMNH2-dependent dimethyl sulfone monooxygenase
MSTTPPAAPPATPPLRRADVPPEPLRFAYWVPNVSGGLVVSTIEQRTDWRHDYNTRLARLAEDSGFDYALTQVRYLASYGAAYQHESTSFSLALLLATERLKVIAAVHPGLWQPGVLAKLVTTTDHLSGGRAAVNVVSGWFKNEFTKLGEPWLEHEERYRRSEEFIRYVRQIWTSEHADLAGDFYRLHDVDMRPKPVEVPGRAHPEVFQGGNSTAARSMAGRVADWYLANGTTPEHLEEQVRDVRLVAGVHGRTVRVGVNGFVVARDTEAEARDVVREIVAKADHTAVEGFGEAVKQAGRSAPDGRGMWQDSSFEDLVQYNDGFRTGLVGTPEQVAERMIELKRHGADLVLCGFLHYLEDVEHFGREVLPLVREMEAAELAGAGVAR